jgi:hypothetical protein
MDVVMVIVGVNDMNYHRNLLAISFRCLLPRYPLRVLPERRELPEYVSYKLISLLKGESQVHLSPDQYADYFSHLTLLSHSITPWYYNKLKNTITSSIFVVPFIQWSIGRDGDERLK